MSDLGSEPSPQVPSENNAKPEPELVVDVKGQLILPNARYKVSLSELVSKVVSSDNSTYQELLRDVQSDFKLEEQLFDVRRADDWEKALNDEASFQFSSKHRPLVEAVLNGIDSELRREVNSSSSVNKTVSVEVRDSGFKIQDHGEGMDLDTVLIRLLVPKLTGNMINQTEVIGRFGVGFYSLLSYLKDKNDNVIVRTNSGDESYRVSISRYFGDDESQHGKLSVVISPLNDLDKEKLGRGTEVEVNSQNFDKTGAENYLNSSLKFKQDATLTVNNQTINDISAYKVTESTIETWGLDKPKKVRLVESSERTDQAKVILTVGGVKVEELVVTGRDLPSEFIVDLPSSTALPKSRDKVEINEETIATISTIGSLSLDTDNHQAADRLALLTPLVDRLQSRNPHVQRNFNMTQKLQEHVRKWMNTVPSNHFFLADAPGVSKLNLPDAIAIDARYLPKNTSVRGYEGIPLSRETNAYWVPFKNENELFATGFKAIYLNERFKTSDPRVLGMLNALVSVYNRTVDSESQKIEGYFQLKPQPEPKQSLSYASHTETTQRANDMNDMDNQEKEVEVDELTKFFKTLKPSLPKTPHYEIDEYEVVQDVPIPDEEYRQLIHDATKHLDQGTSYSKILDRFMPGRQQEKEKEKQRIIGGIPTSRSERTTIKDKYERGFDYETFSSVEQLRQAWSRMELIADLNDMSRSPNEGRSFYTTQYIPYISDDVDFWKNTLAEPFLQSIPEYMLKDTADFISSITNQLPPEIKTEVENSLSSSHPDTQNPKYILPNVESVLREALTKEDSTLDGEAKSKATQLYLLLRLNDRFEDRQYKSLYGDTEFLQTLSEGGEFAGEVKKLTRDMGGTYNAGIDSMFFPRGHNVFDNQWESLKYINTTEGRIQYMQWFQRNERKSLELYRKLMSDYNSKKTTDTGETLGYTVGTLETDLLEAGIDSDESWNKVYDNIETLANFFSDPKARNLLFEQSYHDKQKYYTPPIRYLFAGDLNPENISSVVSKLEQGNFISVNSLKKYREQALAYSYLPPDSFNKLNELLYRIGTEQNIALERFIQDSKEFSDYDYKGLLNDGWDTEHLINTSRYRPYADTEELILKRVEVLDKLPAEYARVYLRLQRLLVDPETGHELRSYTDQVTAADSKLLPMFNKIAELPQDQATTILTRLSHEAFHGKSSLVERLNAYGSIDKDVRPWLYYLLTEGEEIKHVEKKDFFEGIEDRVSFSGSDLVGHYFTSDTMQDIESIQDLKNLVYSSQESGRAKEVGQRRIEHAVNYQSTEGYMWLRELVQNAYNATRETDVKEVSLSNYIEGADFVINVTDPLGMSLNKVVNALLVPQKSDWGSKESLGYFGHGFYTVFKDAQQVRVKTSTGDGTTLYLTVNPLRDWKTNKVIDLQITAGSKPEPYKGTSVQWVKSTDFQDYESYKAKSELTTYAGLVPAGEMSIVWDGEQVNKNPEELGSANSEKGQIRVFAMKGENTLTQNGLFVKPLDIDYTSAIPYTVQRLLLQNGIVIDLPRTIQLIDSRADIASKEDVLPVIKRAITEASIKGAANLFISGRFNLDFLPYDFLEKTEQYIRFDDDIDNDVRNLNTNEPVDWNKYIEDDNKTFQLLMSIPIIELNDEKISIFSAILSAKSDPAILEAMPEKFRRILNRSMQNDFAMRSLSSEDFERNGFVEVDDFTTETLGDYDSYQAWHDLQRQLLNSTIAITGKDYSGTFYASPEGSRARYNPLTHTIGWNLQYMERPISTLSRLLRNEPVNDYELQSLYFDIAHTGSHEYQHRNEDLENVMTHNRPFFQGQQAVLEQMIRDMKLQQIEENMKAKYKGGYISPKELSIQMSQRR